MLVSIKGTIGRVCVVPNELANANISRDSAVIPICDPEWADFVKIFLESDLGQLQMTLHSRGAAAKGINLEDLRKVAFPAIDPEDRDLLVNRFAEVATAVKRLTEQAESTESLRRVEFESLHEFFASTTGIHRFPLPWFGKSYILDVKEEWDRFDVLGANTSFARDCDTSKRFTQLSSICEVDGSNEQIPTGPQLYLAIDECPGRYWGEIEPNLIEVEEGTGRKRFDKGDIAWAHLKPSILQGKAFFVREACWGSHHFLALRTSSLRENLRLVIWAYLKLVPISRHLANQCTGKSESQKDVSAAQLMNLPFPELTKKQVDVIADEIRYRLEKTSDLKSKAEFLRSIASSVLGAANSNIVGLLEDSKFAHLMRAAESSDTFASADMESLCNL